jgi:uncharacterized Zn finger protein (UPF0148 family)
VAFSGHCQTAAMNTVPAVLIPDYNGFWCELSQLYWSQQTLSLVSRHPLSSVEEIVSLFCPQCLARYSEDEAIESHGTCASCVQCPLCSCVLFREGEGLRCKNCTYNRESVLNPAADVQQKAFGLLVQSKLLNTTKASVAASAARNSGKMWQMEELNNKLAADSLAQLVDVDQARITQIGSLASQVDATETRPVSVKLLSKRAVRSQPDPRTGRLNSLVQPKTLPLEGDSSLKLQRGKWWVKDSSAVHELPFVSLLSLPTAAQLQSGEGDCSMTLCLTNPKVSEVTVIFSSQGQVAAAQAAAAPFRWFNKMCTSKLVQCGQVLTPAEVSDAGQQQDLRVHLGAYEDELLKDAASSASESAVQPSNSEGPEQLAEGITGSSESWRCEVVHNKATLTIPVRLQGMDAMQQGAGKQLQSERVAEYVLALDCTVDLGAGCIVDFPIRVLFN